MFFVGPQSIPTELLSRRKEGNDIRFIDDSEVTNWLFSLILRTERKTIILRSDFHRAKHNNQRMRL
jgi:hypothetical protein